MHINGKLNVFSTRIFNKISRFQFL